MREGIPRKELAKSARLKKKMLDIIEEGRKLQGTIDGIIQKGQERIESSLKPQALRQMIGGAVQMLYRGLTLQYHGRGDAGYAGEEVSAAIRVLINKFVV